MKKQSIRIIYNIEQKQLTLIGPDGSMKGYIGNIAVKRAKELLLKNEELTTNSNSNE